MGNHALRKLVGEAIKRAKLPVKLYRGKQGKHRLKARWLKDLVAQLQFRPGDVVSDCDGSNHIIKSLRWYKNTNNRWWGTGQRGYVLTLSQCAFEDGTYSCGCSGSPGEPYTREYVESGWLNMTEEEKAACDIDGRTWRIYCWLKAGGHICDENGIIMPKWRKIYK